MPAPAAISGVRVLEGRGRYAVAICGSLLAQLGADVICVEGPDENGRPSLAGLKSRMTCKSAAEAASTRRDLAADVDVLIGDPATLPALSDDGPIQCAISATGKLRHPEINPDAPEILLQALGGLMATTGQSDGPPQVVRIPILEVFAGIDAATAILAALRVVESGGPAQFIDASLWDTNANLLGTFVAQATSGKASGYRDGARHTICAPWNVYPARNGFVMICTSSDLQWWRLLEVMNRADAASDSRFADMTSRRKNITAVDALVGSWTATMNVDDVVVLLKKNGIPAGAIASPSTVVGPMVAQPFRLSRTPLLQTSAARSSAGSDNLRLRKRVGYGIDSAEAPLKNIRVVEIGPFTAGPLVGRSLSDLGADVIKVEPPKGEVSRSWSPRAGHVSGYFANYNVGKRSVVLDLGSGDGSRVLERLLSSADVLVQNLKAGALEKLGFGVEAVTARHQRLIYCSISGYGQHGPQHVALDTVIQAESGIMSLVGHAATPSKVGFSVSDIIAGHLAVLGIFAALRARDRDGLGQHVDLSMLGALNWLMESGADYPKSAFEVADCVRTQRGWALRLGAAGDLPERDILVRELGEVFTDPSLRARGMLRAVPSSAGCTANIMGSPYPLSRTPPSPGKMIGEPGADGESVLTATMMRPQTHGGLA